MIFVCAYGCVVGPLETGLYKLNGGSGRRHAVVNPGPTRPPDPLHIRKNTQNKVSPLTRLQMGKKYVFRDPRDAI